VWQYRVHVNVLAVAASSGSTHPAWGVLSWFVPFVNFVTPFRAIREIQRVSAGGDPTGARVVAWLWWTTWLAGFVATTVGVTGAVFDVISAMERSQASVRFAADLSAFTIRAFFVGELLLVASSILALTIVWDITLRQRGSVWRPTHRDASSTPSSQAPPRPDVG